MDGFFLSFHMAKQNDLIFGIYPVIEALKSEVNLDKIYVQKGIQNNKLDFITSTAQERGIQINWVPSQKLDYLTKSNHQGVAAITAPIGTTTASTEL